jgi:hypothetical protein
MPIPTIGWSEKAGRFIYIRFTEASDLNAQLHQYFSIQNNFAWYHKANTLIYVAIGADTTLN